MEYSINIKSFGAIPDGITDCSSVFQQAADTLTNGGIFYIPAGTYRLHHTVRFSYDHITIVGEGHLSHIIFDYAQKEQDTPSDASAFAFAEGIRDVTVRDLKIEYEGYFYPNSNESYSGKSSGLCFTQCFEVLIEHCEISGFNANGVNIVTGDSSKYAEHVRVDKCYLHHNRVAGVLFGYVDCICISNCDLNYHGAPLDGGTGYGCAGCSGEYPRNVQIVNNRARYNYRKGLDLHAGIQAIIEGNICDSNRLYGIYTEGLKSGDVIIRGNIITGMEWENTGFPLPYEWIHGISVGAWGATPYESDHFNYMIAENEIRGFGLETQYAYPFYVYGNLKNGTFLFKNNYVQCGIFLEFLITPKPPNSGCPISTSAEILSLHAKLKEKPLISAISNHS